MDEGIREHVQAIAARPEDVRRRVATHVVRACWPAGPGDRSRPAALEWLRRWRPERIGTSLPACSCHRGRCPVCN